MAEKLPFSYRLKPILKELVRHVDPEIRDRLLGDIQRTTDKVDEQIKASGEPIAYRNTDRAELFVSAYTAGVKTAPISVAEVVAFTLENDHSFVQDWTEEEKRFFLDTAFDSEITRLQQKIKQTEILGIYFPQTLRARAPTDLTQMKITTYTELQRRLRQKVSTTPPEKRR